MIASRSRLLEFLEFGLPEGFWPGLAAIAAATLVGLGVVFTIARPPADFIALAPLAVIRDAQGRPAWYLRLAREARQIAIDADQPPAAPPERSYQLWLAGAEGDPARPLALLPRAGRRVVAITPANARRLAAAGELIVTLEQQGGSPAQIPFGPVVLRAAFP